VRLIFALAFFGLVTPAAAQVSSLFPLDRFWTHKLDSPFAAPPVTDGQRVYAALRTGQFVALDPRTGTVAWSVELAAEGAPLAAEGRVFIPAAGAIQALDAATGTLAWRLPAAALAAPLAHRGGWLIVALAGGGLQGVRASDGVVVWSQATGAALASAPALDGDLLAAALTDGRILAMNVTTGKPRWERLLGSPAGSLALSGDRIFAGTADGQFWALETKNGDLAWHWTLGARLIGAPAADAERVYAVAMDNVVRGFSRRSGNMKWNYPLPTRPLSGALLTEGLLVITSGDIGAPGLTYIEAATGKGAGRTPPLRGADETTRTQFAVDLAKTTAPIAIIATATTSGDWQLHGYRRTMLSVGTRWLAWGERHLIRRRLEIRKGPIVWGTKVPLEMFRSRHAPRIARGVPEPVNPRTCAPAKRT
jgi:outer membrane protein assembly factor BamB